MRGKAGKTSKPIFHLGLKDGGRQKKCDILKGLLLLRLEIASLLIKQDFNRVRAKAVS